MKQNADAIGLYYDEPSYEEYNNGDIMVETAGYIPKEDQLTMLLSSGRALDEYYKALYPDYVPQSEEPSFDPTVQKGFDFFDAHENMTFVLKSMRMSEEQLNPDADRTAPLETKDGIKEPPADVPAAGVPNP